jgi:hypothetical protein
MKKLDISGAFWSEIPKKRDNLRDQGIDGRIVRIKMELK